MNFSNDYDITTEFFTKFRSLAIDDYLRWRVEFRTLEQISPATALVLVAELDRARLITNHRLRAFDMPEWRPEIRRMFTDLGFFDILKVVNKPIYTISDEGLDNSPIQFIRFISGETASGKDAAELRRKLEDATGHKIEKHSHYRAVSEAMTNVGHHAYPDEYKILPNILPMWWATGSYDPRHNRLSVIIFDQGIGIPASLPRKHKREVILGLLKHFNLTNDDAAMIQAAVELGRTRTDVQHQGKGLTDMLKYAQETPDGHLRIISGSGEYEFLTNGAQKLLQHNASIGGTLIQWEFSP